MSTVQALEKLVTGEELYQMPRLGRCELVEGRIVRMSPTGNRHGSVEFNIAHALGRYAEAHGGWKVRVGEVGVFTKRQPDTVRGADVLLMSDVRHSELTTPGFLTVAPELVVEVLSPDDRWGDVMRKVKEYLDAGVTVVWIADPDSRSVFAYRSLTDSKVFHTGDIVTDEDLLPGLSLPVADVFRD
ncbi:MAG: Uma2 family endonuclease [Acidobacteriota bacterium]